MVLLPLSLKLEAETVPTPGAKMALHVPKFEKLARTFLESEAPTPMAEAMKVKDFRQESVPLLPALTMTATPEFTTASTATREDSGVE